MRVTLAIAWLAAVNLGAPSLPAAPNPAPVVAGSSAMAPDSLATEQVNGPLGGRLDAELTRFAEYFVTSSDTLELRRADDHMYALANRAQVPMNVMFFPTDNGTFTGFDPRTASVSRLRFVDAEVQTLEIQLVEKRSISARIQQEANR